MDRTNREISMEKIVEINGSNNLVAYLDFAMDYNIEISSSHVKEEIIDALIRDMKWHLEQMDEEEKEEALASFNVEELGELNFEI